ncbi:hypothetical protein [uncultured Kordia sp.]|uniref:hypothetical protein n=1 Tax=uncultured Kordia sp. TaxID=507699 RepID=UPI00262A4C8B|nr:hypothetical protein [uncultured Kordia sp.]
MEKDRIKKIIVVLTCFFFLQCVKKDNVKDVLEGINLKEWDKSTSDFVLNQCNLDDATLNYKDGDISLSTKIEGVEITNLQDHINYYLSKRKNLIDYLKSSEPLLKRLKGEELTIIEIYGNDFQFIIYSDEMEKMFRYEYDKQKKVFFFELLDKATSGDYYLGKSFEETSCTGKINSMLKYLTIFSTMKVNDENIEYQIKNVHLE